MVSQDSTIMANAKASPPVLTDAGQWGGRVRVVMDSFETIAAGGATSVDDDGDFFRLCALPSNARIIQFWVASDDLDSSSATVLNYGLNTADSTEVLDEDLFASAVAHASAVAPTDIRFEAAATNIARWQQPLWEVLDAGAGTVTSDPGIMYDVVATQNAASTTTTAGTFSFCIMYTVD